MMRLGWFDSVLPFKIRGACLQNTAFHIVANAFQIRLRASFASGDQDGLRVGGAEQPPALRVEDANAIDGDCFLIFRIFPNPLDNLEFYLIGAVKARLCCGGISGDFRKHVG